MVLLRRNRAPGQAARKEISASAARAIASPRATHDLSTARIERTVRRMLRVKHMRLCQ